MENFVAFARSDDVYFLTELRFGVDLLSATFMAKQSSWYCQEALDLGSCVCKSCIVELYGVIWVFRSCSTLFSSGFSGLLCVQILVFLLLVPPINVSRIPLNIHLDFFSFFLFLLNVLRAAP